MTTGTGGSIGSGTVVVAAAHLVDADGDHGAGWLRIKGGLIAERGEGTAPESSAVVTTLVDTIHPGLVDIHVHGAVGADFAQVGVDPTPAIAHHHAQGATSILASLATAESSSTLRRVEELRPFVTAGDLGGLHLEGPWLSQRRRGAHAPGLLRAPDLRELDALLEAGDGAIRMVTLAPELPGALAAIAQLVRHGVTAAIGHTDADADTVDRAVDAGATVVTHLFNGMAPLHHREPGVVGAALSRGDLALELIADGVHVDDRIVDTVLAAAADRLVLVSDAMAATGLGDGSYELAGSRVVVSRGVAELADGTSLAGSTTPLGRIVSRLSGRGIPLASLIAAASTRAAAVVGIPAPALTAGRRADLVAVSGDGSARTMRGGRWLGC